MPTVLLTDIRVRQLKPSDVQVTYWDTQLRGFGVRVGRQRKTWLVMRGKKRTRVTLGHDPQLGLSEARKKAMAALGETPTTIANRMNFETALEKFVTQHLGPAPVVETERVAKPLGITFRNGAQGLLPTGYSDSYKSRPVDIF